MTKNKEELGCPMCECETCCKLIPESAATTAEGADYVKYFCGSECYKKLQKKQKTRSDEKTKE